MSGRGEFIFRVNVLHVGGPVHNRKVRFSARLDFFETKIMEEINCLTGNQILRTLKKNTNSVDLRFHIVYFLLSINDNLDLLKNKDIKIKKGHLLKVTVRQIHIYLLGKGKYGAEKVSFMADCELCL